MKSPRVSFLVVLSWAAASASAAAPKLPSVDVGYGVYGATAYDTAGDFYSFRNIRYADPPRPFSQPVAPTPASRQRDDGVGPRTCPQAYPYWLLEQLAPQYALTTAQLQAYLYSSPVTDDCLFLDLSVPKSVFDRRRPSITSQPTPGAAVLVWIYGGGFDIGTKEDAQFDPAGLISQSQADGQEGVIVVKINYRLGLFGWLGDGDGVTRNAGLLDQRLALEWVQKYAPLFGGDPKRVTVMGESAGGASIIHHITAYGGSRGSVPFQRAIVQSPGYAVSVDASRGLGLALAAASRLTGRSITTPQQLGRLDAATLIQVNRAVVNQSTPGSWTYGPVPDGDYVPDVPSFLLRDGRFDPEVQVMSGHNVHEAAAFVPAIDSDERFRAAVQATVFSISDAALDDVVTRLYPNDLSGRYGYTTQTQRLTALSDDAAFKCNTRFLGRAPFARPAYGYVFAYPPSVHQQDVAFTWFHGDAAKVTTPGTRVDPALAAAMQRSFTRFAQTGRPNGDGGGDGDDDDDYALPAWPAYGGGAAVLTFGLPSPSVDEEAPNARCDYWQSGAWR